MANLPNCECYYCKRNNSDMEKYKFYPRLHEHQVIWSPTPINGIDGTWPAVVVNPYTLKRKGQTEIREAIQSRIQLKTHLCTLVFFGNIINKSLNVNLGRKNQIYYYKRRYDEMMREKKYNWQHSRFLIAVDEAETYWRENQDVQKMEPIDVEAKGNEGTGKREYNTQGLTLNQPVFKKPRMLSSLPQDPLIPLPVGLSPFDKSPELVIRHIFSLFVGDIRAKMQLELICKTFQCRLKERTSWKFDIDELVLASYAHGTFCINSVEFSSEQAPKALLKLLQRITIRKILFNGFKFDQVLVLSISNQINRCLDSFALQSIRFENDHSNNSSTERSLQILITTLVRCRFNQVKQITVSGSSFRDNFFRSFWAIVMNCTELKSLAISTGHYEISLDELYNCIGQNCPLLETLKLDIEAVVNVDLMAKLCNTLNHLKYLHIDAIIDAPTKFVSLLTEQQRSKIETLSLYANTDESDEEEDEEHLTMWENFAQSTIAMFANMKEFCLRAGTPWRNEPILAVVQNVITNFANRGPYSFKLSLQLQQKDRQEFLAQLTDGNGIDAQVVIAKCKYKCIKGDVQIDLDID